MIHIFKDLNTSEEEDGKSTQLNFVRRILFFGNGVKDQRPDVQFLD